MLAIAGSCVCWACGAWLSPSWLGSVRLDGTGQLNATHVPQGSGWGWLGYNKGAGRLEIATMPNQVCTPRPSWVPPPGMHKTRTRACTHQVQPEAARACTMAQLSPCTPMRLVVARVNLASTILSIRSPPSWPAAPLCVHHPNMPHYNLKCAGSPAVSFLPTKLSLNDLAVQDPLSMTGLVPLLGIDVWEHAYYLDYKNARPDYLKVCIWTCGWVGVNVS